MLKKILLALTVFLLLQWLPSCSVSKDLTFKGVLFLPKTPTADDVQQQNATYYRYMVHFENNNIER